MPEENRTLGYLEGQIHGVLQAIEVLRGELKEVRSDARADRKASEDRIMAEIHEMRDENREAHASVTERVGRLETALSRNQGEDSAEARFEAHGHSWRQTAMNSLAGLVAGFAAALATWLTAGRH